MKRYSIIAGLLFQALICIAQPAGIHLSWNGRKTVKTATTMAITWMNAIHDRKVKVVYGEDSTRLDRSARAKEKYSNDLQVYISKVTLIKLQPGTNYYYKVGSVKSGWSAVYQFRTSNVAGSTKKFTAGIWSDTQNNKGNLDFEQSDSMVKQLGRHSFDLMLHNGDIVENGSVEASWKKFFTIAQPLLARSPFMSVTGNHDVVNDAASPDFQKPFPQFYDIFNLPGDQLNYSYDHGNVHFIAINSGYAQGAEKKGKVLFEPGSPEYKWLESDLAKARKNKNCNWIILYCHYPVYSFGVSHVQTWQEHLTPLLDKYRVDLCLAGHRHVYERHYAIFHDQVLPQKDQHVYDQPGGTVYITNGSAGGSLQGVGGKNMPDMIFTPAEKMFTYALMSVEGSILTYNVYNKNGDVIDHFTIRKKK